MPGQRKSIEMGPFSVTVTMGLAEDPYVNFGRTTIERRSMFCFFASAVVQLALLVAMAYSPPTLSELDPLTENENSVWLVQQMVSSDGTTRDDEGPEVLLGIATEELRYAEQVQGIPSRCVGYDEMGRRSAAKASLRYAVTGPIDNPDPHLSRKTGPKKHTSHWDQSNNQKIGIVGQAMDSDPEAPTAPWGRDTSLGTDEVSARGNMWGDAVGDAAGDGGMLKSSLDGGLLKRIEVVRPAQAAPSRPARVMHSQLSVKGSLSPHDVELTVAPRMAAFRDCYRADRSSRGDSEAHLEIGFAIGSTGQVSDIHVLKSEQLAAPLLRCILASAENLQFPAENGDSKVTFPLHFLPASGEASRPVEVIALAKTIRRETDLPLPCDGKVPYSAKKLQPCPR